jgi:hypothetical protein
VPDTGEIALTLTVVSLWQPVLNTYEMGDEPLPTPTAVTIPLVEPTVATLVFPLTHVPPAVTQLRVVVAFAQKVVVPVINVGNGFTVTVVVAKQPPGNV